MAVCICGLGEELGGGGLRGAFPLRVQVILIFLLWTFEQYVCFMSAANSCFLTFFLTCF